MPPEAPDPAHPGSAPANGEMERHLQQGTTRKMARWPGVRWFCSVCHCFSEEFARWCVFVFFVKEKKNVFNEQKTDSVFKKNFKSMFKTVVVVHLYIYLFSVWKPQYKFFRIFFFF